MDYANPQTSLQIKREQYRINIRYEEIEKKFKKNRKIESKKQKNPSDPQNLISLLTESVVQKQDINYYLTLIEYYLLCQIPEEQQQLKDNLFHFQDKNYYKNKEVQHFIDCVNQIITTQNTDLISKTLEVLFLVFQDNNYEFAEVLVETELPSIFPQLLKSSLLSQKDLKLIYNTLNEIIQTSILCCFTIMNQCDLINLLNEQVVKVEFCDAIYNFSLLLKNLLHPDRRIINNKLHPLIFSITRLCQYLNNSIQNNNQEIQQGLTQNVLQSVRFYLEYGFQQDIDDVIKQDIILQSLEYFAFHQNRLNLKIDSLKCYSKIILGNMQQISVLFKYNFNILNQCLNLLDSNIFSKQAKKMKVLVLYILSNLFKQDNLITIIYENKYPELILDLTHNEMDSNILYELIWCFYNLYTQSDLEQQNMLEEQGIDNLIIKIFQEGNISNICVAIELLDQIRIKYLNMKLQSIPKILQEFNKNNLKNIVLSSMNQDMEKYELANMILEDYDKLIDQIIY